ncbi:hypothetical protein HK105_208409 [Polyrhizophydium stewartii]|uniref:Phytocyanin domain-containing protein n=1 Tax=Polyrhizophydium stewartii TaxID=2732419 RepID=A0ABR4MXY6_9FUNG|nr:hypothetical protein HK105_005495 [Polyrhizophydium stewartii]
MRTLAGTLSAALWAAAAAVSAVAAAPQNWVVGTANHAFQPVVTTVHPGDTVTFVFQSARRIVQTVGDSCTENKSGWDSGTHDPGAIVTYTPPGVGTFYFTSASAGASDCYTGMRARIVVVPLPAPTTASAPKQTTAQSQAASATSPGKPGGPVASATATTTSTATSSGQGHQNNLADQPSETNFQGFDPVAHGTNLPNTGAAWTAASGASAAAAAVAAAVGMAAALA